MTTVPPSSTLAKPNDQNNEAKPAKNEQKTTGKEKEKDKDKEKTDGKEIKKKIPLMTLPLPVHVPVVAKLPRENKKRPHPSSRTSSDQSDSYHDEEEYERTHHQYARERDYEHEHEQDGGDGDGDEDEHDDDHEEDDDDDGDEDEDDDDETEHGGRNGEHDHEGGHGNERSSCSDVDSEEINAHDVAKRQSRWLQRECTRRAELFTLLSDRQVSLMSIDPAQLEVLVFGSDYSIQDLKIILHGLISKLKSLQTEFEMPAPRIGLGLDLDDTNASRKIMTDFISTLPSFLPHPFGKPPAISIEQQKSEEEALVQKKTNDDVKGMPVQDDKKKAKDDKIQAESKSKSLSSL